MEEQCSPLSWGYCYQDEGSEELKYSFLYTLELESTIVSAKEEIAKREVEVIFSISSSADCNNKDINVATSLTSPKPQPPLLLQPQAALSSAAEKPLPEKGRLLKAVMEAGPLLQTLLLAGPLPQWQHPPPKLDSIEIPPVSISSSSPRLSNQASFNSINSCFSNKRGFDQLNEDSDHSSPISKYQKLVALH
ncbi:hypothetical protein CUMW_157110 [Citrus unshiu]|nr:hypothetical protein CUMW_157110 [Citrus unshiu]